MKVLVIEPDRVLADTYKKFLDGEGFEVALASGTVVAVESLDEAKPDVILLELMANGHSGIEFLYEIRSYTDLRDIPTVILSTTNVGVLKENKRQLELLNISDVLYRPNAKLKDIKRAIDEAIQD